jgi:cell wall-associated NlpC family hydrolase
MKDTIRYAFALCGIVCSVYLTSCDITAPQPRNAADTLVKNVAYTNQEPVRDTPVDPAVVAHFEKLAADSGTTIKTGNTKPDELMRFAETLIGTPYVWAASDPQVGFDCSGFITYVFSHFNISVPRSSIDFFNVGKTIAVEEAKRGDFILFTGTDPMETSIGHMGLVVSNNGSQLNFIHSTSGKAMSVTISPLSEQYKKRFIRISRIF